MCADLDAANYYWQHMTLASFMTYIPLICIITFQLLFIKKKYYFKYTLTVMLLQYFAMLTGNCMVAATVSGRALRGHPKVRWPRRKRRLTNASSRRQFNSVIQRYRIPIAEYLNYMKLLTRFEGDPIGFSCYNFFILTDETYMKVCHALRLLNQW